MEESGVTRFSATTRRITAFEGAAATAAREFGPAVTTWARGGDRLDGFGVAARLVFRGAGRLREAGAAWRRLSADSTVDDAVGAPGSGLIAFGTFAFADDSAAESVLIVPRVVVGRRDGVAFATTVTGSAADLPGTASQPTPPMPPAAYVAAVRTAVERIRAGDLEKVVLARHVPIASADDVGTATGRLRARYGEAWVFAVDGFFGASPETLVTTRDSAMTSRVLAGTVGRGAGAAADDAARTALLESPKNRFEHALAVDSLLLTLGGLVQGLVIGRPFALGLPNVWHLATDASGTVADGVGTLDLVTALHPTAAVAGAPRDTALALIAELEPFDRGRYAGPVGWVDAAGDGEWAIGLRSAQREGPALARAFAGAGIVAASDAESELAETALKLLPIVEALHADPRIAVGQDGTPAAPLPS